jgi:hypothetical protein
MIPDGLILVLCVEEFEGGAVLEWVCGVWLILFIFFFMIAPLIFDNWFDWVEGKEEKLRIR